MIQNLFIRWMIKGAVFFLLIITTFVTLLVLLPVNEHSFIAAINDKRKLLELTPGARVIEVGGSSVAFGLDSKLLSDLVSLPVINDGLNIHLGMRFPLNDLVPFLHPGDLVVLAPEYPVYYNDTLEGNDSDLALLLDVYPRAVQSFGASQYIRLPYFYILILRSRILRLANVLISRSEVEDPVFNRSSFNDHGDMVAHLGMPSISNIENEAYIGESFSYNSSTIVVLNRFARQAREKGATVYLVYPPSRNTNCIKTQSRFEQLDDYLRNRLDFPILSHPIDTCLADDLFFDTNYHLNAEGRQLRTRWLATLLINQDVLNFRFR